MKKILLLITTSTFLFSSQFGLPKITFDKPFYIENKCDFFNYKDKEFLPKDCFYKKDIPFDIDYCITVEKSIMCISSKNRLNYILNTDFITKDNKIILKNKIIEVNKIVYTNKGSTN